MTEILVRPAELRQAAEELRSRAQKVDRALQLIDSAINQLKGDSFLGHRANALQSNYQSKREALQKAKELILHFVADLETAAQVFEKADQQSVDVASSGQDFDTWRHQVSWKVQQVAGEEPVLILSNGQQISFADLRSGKPEALKAYSEFLGKSADAFTIMEEISKAKWVDVSGYLSKNGNWVDDYWRSLPGGHALAKKLGYLGLAISAADIGSSIFQAVTDKAENQWVSIPLGIIDGKEIVYTYYLPKQDHWRDVVTKTGGVIGGTLGAAGGALVGAELGPGAIVPAIGGAIVGSEAGESLSRGIYDGITGPDNIPARPKSMLGGEVNGDAIQTFQNDDTTQIDVGQLVSGTNGKGQATLTFDVDETGKSHLNYVITPSF